jgi:hypothetical protein
MEMEILLSQKISRPAPVLLRRGDTDNSFVMGTLYSKVARYRRGSHYSARAQSAANIESISAGPKKCEGDRRKGFVIVDRQQLKTLLSLGRRIRNEDRLGAP